MNEHSIDTARDQDLRLSQAAMLRAAQRARELAAQTGTCVVVSHNGVIETVSPGLGSADLQVQEPSVPYGDKP